MRTSAGALWGMADLCVYRLWVRRGIANLAPPPGTCQALAVSAEDRLASPFAQDPLPMKIVSFNINGLRARPHQLQALIEKHQPDVIGLQETKVADEQFPESEIRQLGYHVHYHGQKGHYGVALLSRQEPLSLHKGFPGDTDDAQRRFIYGTFADAQGNPVTVMNGYFPQVESRDHPVKFPAKQRFYADLQALLESRFAPSQPLVVMGDIN